MVLKPETKKFFFPKFPTGGENSAPFFQSHPQYHGVSPPWHLYAGSGEFLPPAQQWPEDRDGHKPDSGQLYGWECGPWRLQPGAHPSLVDRVRRIAAHRTSYLFPLWQILQAGWCQHKWGSLLPASPSRVVFQQWRIFASWSSSSTCWLASPGHSSDLFGYLGRDKLRIQSAVTIATHTG